MTDKEDLPRPNSSLYNLLCADEEIKSKTIKKYKRFNKYFTIPFYKIRLLPAIGFGRLFLILETVGRNSGKKRKSPLEYHWYEGAIHVVSGRGEDSDWLKNIRANPDKVWIRHGFHYFKAKVEFLNDFDEKNKMIKWYVTKHPKAAKMLFGWDEKTDDPEKTDFSKLLNLITIMRFHEEKE